MKQRFWVGLLAVCLFLVARTAHADKVDDLVRAEMEKQRVPGLSIAVVQDGKVVKAQGYGFANLEHKVPATADTIYQSGSVGKQFTSAAVMLLVEDGKIGLDDNISKYFPNTPDTWKEITVRHLLTHTSGIPGYDYGGKFDLRKDYTEDELLQEAMKLTLDFPPGTQWKYSNTGYVLLGILIGKVSGKFYGDFLKERVFTPLGMTTARVINEADIIPNRAAGYDLVKGEWKNQGWVSPVLNTTADGSLYFTVQDMAKWDLALYSDKLLKKSSRDAMWTPVKLADGKTQGYGFGWSLGDTNGHKTIEHGGAWQGFTTYIARYPDDKLTVIVLTNRSGSNPGRIAKQIASSYIAALTPPAANAIEDKEPKVTELVRDTLLKTADGTLTPERFTSEMATALFPDKVSQAKDFLKSAGPLKSLSLLARKDVADNRAYRYRAEYRDMVLVVVVTLTKDDKIAGLGIQPE